MNKKVEGERGDSQQEASESKEELKEIERKFLIKSLPENLEQYPQTEIIQGYIVIAEDGTEVRLRKEGNEYFQILKKGRGKIRAESIIEITKEQFEALWHNAEDKRIEKTRYKIPYRDRIIELDVYHGNLAGFSSVEVEFGSEESSEKFVPPDWFGKEVTEDKEYKNQSLALHGLPKEVSAKLKSEKDKEISNIPEYHLAEGIEKLTNLIKKKMAHQRNEPIIVEIAGGSASGKTSAVAAKLKEIFGDEAVIVSMDDYYRGKKFMQAEAQKGNLLNWDQPEALNLELLHEHLWQLKARMAIQKPVYSFKISEPVGSQDLFPQKVIIIEGLFALNDSLVKAADVKVFVDIGVHGRILRRLLRDTERTGQKPADILKYFAEIVEPMHDKYIDSTKKNADLIIKNEYCPKVEAKKSGLHEIQLKFRAEIDDEQLRRLGAEKLSSTIQIDHYYNPPDRNLIETEEILRIREESGHRILTYKGPKTESEFRKRPKFEFEIDQPTENKFLGIYGDKIKTIKKERTIYQLDGAMFSVDLVSKIEDDKTNDLGKFIEIRSTDKEASEEKLKSVLSKLGLSTEDGIKESYFEM